MSTPNWEALIEEYSHGAADVEIAKLLKITIGRFYQLCEENPTFADFAERGRTLSQAWWYEQGRKGLYKKEMNIALWNFNMKNRFGWADKTDINDTTDKSPVNLDQAKGQLATALKKLGEKSPELLSGVNLKIVSKNAND